MVRSNTVYSQSLGTWMAVDDVLVQIHSLQYQGTFIITKKNGRVYNVSYSSNSKSEIINTARAFFISNPDILKIELPKFSMVLY